MRADIVQYYYKDLGTGVEVTFSKTAQWGWAVQFHVSKEDLLSGVVDDIVLPWPSLSDEEQKIVDANYENLYKSLEGD